MQFLRHNLSGGHYFHSNLLGSNIQEQSCFSGFMVQVDQDKIKLTRNVIQKYDEKMLHFDSEHIFSQISMCARHLCVDVAAAAAGLDCELRIYSHRSICFLQNFFFYNYLRKSIHIIR